MIKCRSCGSQELRRSSARPSERIRRALFGGDPFRCRDCGWRGWRRHEETSEPYVEKKKSKAPRFDPNAALGAVVLIVLIVAAVGLILAFNSSMFAAAL